MQARHRRGARDEVALLRWLGRSANSALGLDISWRIVVDRHHGDLRVESEPGDTKFEVLLPLEEQPSR